MEENKKIVYSALKPTGDLQLGNYIGALRNMVKMQDEYNCVYMVADLHSLTVSNLPADLRRRTYDFMALFLAIGLDPEKCVLAVQSHVPEHSELGWILNCYTMFGEASRMTQFKDKSLKNPDNVNVGLFAYPMLMAADILLYQTDLVPIGKDQKQHVEIARTIAERFNNRYSPTFVVPDCYFPKTGAKIQNLLDPCLTTRTRSQESSSAPSQTAATKLSCRPKSPASATLSRFTACLPTKPKARSSRSFRAGRTPSSRRRSATR